MTAKVNLGPACLVFCVALIGCNNANREQELREQKLLVELAKTNTDRLAELSRKEQNLSAEEKKVLETLAEIKQREESLRTREDEIARNEQAIQDAKGRLRDAELQIQGAQQEVATKPKRLDGIIAQYRDREEAEEKARRELEARNKAHVGKGVKGQGYGGGYIAVVAASYWSTEERLGLMQIQHDMDLFKAKNDGKGPKTHDEFMQKIIKEGAIKLPELPPGQRYQYGPPTETLMILKPADADGP